MKPVRLKKDGFPCAVLYYLMAHGESKNSDIREAVGLNEWCSHSAHADRSSYYFACLIVRLRQRHLVVRTKLGYYKVNDGQTVDWDQNEFLMADGTIYNRPPKVPHPFPELRLY